MNCNEVKARIIDFQEGKLDEETNAFIENHLQTCSDCNQSMQDLNELLNLMEQLPPVLPERSVAQGFDQMLAEAKEQSKPTQPLRSIYRGGNWLRSSLRVAATIALVLTSFWIGRLSWQSSLKSDLANLERENIELNKLVTFSLIEHESASKRLQAVNYARAFADQDAEILNVLIQKIQNDKHVNVRLAAASALAEFTENSLVLEALIRTLEQERNLHMQIELIQILVNIREKRAIPIMKRLLKKAAVPNYLKEQIHSELRQIS